MNELHFNCGICIVVVIIGLLAFLCKRPAIQVEPFISEYTLHGVSDTIKNTDWELNEQKTLLKYVKDGDKILQLGGNIGASCITLDRERTLARNTCVEPNDDIVPILQKNVDTNANNVEVIHGIITNDVKNTYLHKGDGPNMWGANIIEEKDGGQLVNMVSLDKLEEDKPAFNVLFADCEGCLPKFMKEYHSHEWDAIIYEPDFGDDVDYSIIQDIASINGLVEAEAHPGVVAWVKPNRIHL